MHEFCMNHLIKKLYFTLGMAPSVVGMCSVGEAGEMVWLVAGPIPCVVGPPPERASHRFVTHVHSGEGAQRDDTKVPRHSSRCDGSGGASLSRSSRGSFELRGDNSRASEALPRIPDGYRRW
jgi:hypothetical protein